MSDLRLNSAVHLAVDMQLLFAEGPWSVPWLPKILPMVVELAQHHPARSVFTRFIPPRRPEDMPGAWQDYYRRWHTMTRESVDERLLQLVDPLRVLVPRAHLCDKAVYSAFGNPKLAPWLKSQGADTLIVSGGETDVCVLATVMSALDHGFYVVLATDALCSVSDSTHDALLLLYKQRFSQQIATATTEEILRSWN